MDTTTRRRWRCYPRAEPTRQPTPWWYYGRALYVSRRDYFMIYWALMLTLGFPFVFLGLYVGWPFWNAVALGAGTVSLFYLGYSLLFGMYRMYGHPGKRYVRRLLEEAGVRGPAVVADLHIGTYRHSYLLADLLPEAVIHSIDCWGVEGEPKEIAIRDVRDLECPPVHHPRILTNAAENYSLPLPDACCDAVVFGFGTHEIPNDGSRARLFAEAKRVLKPGGKALMFEHGNDFHNVIIFGPPIGHVVARAEWMEMFKTYFADVGYARTSYAVDLFWGTRAEPTGTVCRPLPRKTGRRDSLGNWLVVGLFSLISLWVVAYLPRAHLLALYWGIAILGLTWPWMMIGVALAGDWLARHGAGASLAHPSRLVTNLLRHQSPARR
jgi:SAM-dependent methyltransferase